ncbi:MAG: flagellar basal body P-ring protein FlgI [Armatimonadetes bacterium]|nr:flagellar basal body P-ring protein FlgI [Armatimonadota bacterium]
MRLHTFIVLTLTLIAAASAWGQSAPAQTPPKSQNTTSQTPALSPAQLAEIQKLLNEKHQQSIDSIRTAEADGIKVRLGDIGRFRGARSNVIQGFGLVVGLAGSGDTKSTPWTSTLIANAMSRWGTMVDEAAVRSKNIAAVLVTCEMPPFIAPGSKLDITVSSSGDAKSIEGGVLLPTVLTSMSDPNTPLCTAFGSVSIGGFNASSGGSGVRKNHPNVGIVSGGAIVEKSVPTQFIFEGNVMYFDLDDPDFTTAQRTATAIELSQPSWEAAAIDAATIKVTVPIGTAPTLAAQIVEGTEVMANTPASVVVNERTGTIVVGGNVKLGPAIIAHGSLQVTISTDVVVSQPQPFSKGETVVVAVPQVDAGETDAQVALVAPNATLDDLAKILQTMKVSARDIIAILQALQAQGALKARIKVQ